MQARCNSLRQYRFHGLRCSRSNAYEEFRAAIKGKLQSLHDPYVAEAVSCKEALTWLIAKGFKMIRFELDCVNLYYALINKHEDLSYAGGILSECLNLCSSFDTISFHHIPRSASLIVHTVARDSALLLVPVRSPTRFYL